MKKIIAWSVIPICLLLVTTGIRVPNPANLHCAPKPRPRAIIETAAKSTQDVVTKKVVDLEPCDCQGKLLPPKPFRSGFSAPTRSLSDIALPASCARAPPIPVS